MPYPRVKYVPRASVPDFSFSMYACHESRKPLYVCLLRRLRDAHGTLFLGSSFQNVIAFRKGCAPTLHTKVLCKSFNFLTLYKCLLYIAFFVSFERDLEWIRIFSFRHMAALFDAHFVNI